MRIYGMESKQETQEIEGRPRRWAGDAEDINERREPEPAPAPAPAREGCQSFRAFVVWWSMGDPKIYPDPIKASFLAPRFARQKGEIQGRETQRAGRAGG